MTLTGLVRGLWPPFGGGQASPPDVAVDLRAGFNAYLRGRTGITDLVGTRIRPGFRPQLDQLPGVTYTIVDNPRLQGIAGPPGQAIARVQIDCWSRSLSECVAVKIAVERALDGFRGDMGGVDLRWARQVAEADLHEEPKDASDKWLYRCSVDYHLKHVCPVPER